MSMGCLQSAPGDEPVIVENTFAVAPVRLFEAWTQPKQIKQWFGPTPNGLEAVEVELQIGGAWRFDYGEQSGEQNVLQGNYLEIDSARKLVFSWSHVRHFSDGRTEATPESLVTLTFKSVPQGTFLRLIHERIVQEAGRLGVGHGWDASFTNLLNLVETPTGEHHRDTL